ncbi:unnamed protein product [Bursaphelenchus okinawaensis]|uniref:Uncharacterized protein n=1 Tax=Bursaphelenchus okinawaensis TaxID=465554 RepID=A0A811KBZ3_9BILA|nr:unnamed protein product [Bursaphelenchus okinawaensis]CAG9100597.1 unnamed protein product [Bursaphelenchus okinawaensis]
MKTFCGSYKPKVNRRCLGTFYLHGQQYGSLENVFFLLDLTYFQLFLKKTKLCYHVRDRLFQDLRCYFGLLTEKAYLIIIFERSSNLCQLDFHGCLLVLSVFYKSLRMESGMWFLSTLGGGFSSLGDCGDRESALKALKISEAQFKVALKMNDDFMCGRAILYYGTAMAQLADYNNAFRAVLRVFIYSLQYNNEALFCMSAALYMKIEYLADAGFRRNKQFKALKRLYKNVPAKYEHSLTAIDLYD